MSCDARRESGAPRSLATPRTPRGSYGFTMTEQEAQRCVAEISDKVAMRSHVPSSNARAVFRGGELRAEPHPELATHFRPVWHPEADDLRPLDLQEFTVEAAARQVERYGRATYVPVRRKLEAFLDALLGDREMARESRVQPDSFVLSAGSLSVSEIRRDGREREYRIEFARRDASWDVAPGEAFRGTTTDVTDVTGMSVDELRALVDPDAVARTTGETR